MVNVLKKPPAGFEIRIDEVYVVEIMRFLSDAIRNPREDLRGREAHIQPPAGFEISNDEVAFGEVI